MELALPDHWSVRQTASPSLRAAPGDWADRLAMALGQPVAGPPLSRLLAARPHGRVAVVVEDVTRDSPLPAVLEVLMRELRHGGVTPQRMEVVFATGMHPPMTAAQAAAKLGRAAGDVPWRSNPWHDRSAYVRRGDVGKVPLWLDRGVAEADLRVLAGAVSPHLQAGFGGGWKMLLPGCAHLETIRALHRLGVGTRQRRLVGLPAEESPMRAAIDAGGQVIDAAGGATFAVQFLLDAGGQPAFVSTGAVAPAQQMLAKQCAVSCGVVTGEPADVLITNAYPRDFDLWQSFKCIANTLWAARPGGAVVCLACCEAGAHGMRIPPWPLGPDLTRRLARLVGPEAVHSALTRLLPRLAGDAAFFVRLAAQALCRNPIVMVSPTLHAAGTTFPGVHVVGTMEQAAALVERLLGPGQRRVTVFPAGGITYPVPPPETAP